MIWLRSLFAFRPAHRRQVLNQCDTAFPDLAAKAKRADQMRARVQLKAKCRSYKEWIEKHGDKRSA